MTNVHPLFVSIFRAYGVAPVERLRALDHDSAEDDARSEPSTDGAVPFGDDYAGEKSGDVRKSETVFDRSRHPKAEGRFDSARPLLTPTEDDEEERCRGCGTTREQHDHCRAPCPFDDCPFKETK